jgi:hypothetical protein
MGVNPVRDEFGIGSVTGVVADQVGNGSVRGKLGTAAEPAELHAMGAAGPHWVTTWAACRVGKGGLAGPIVDRSKFQPMAK